MFQSWFGKKEKPAQAVNVPMDLSNFPTHGTCQTFASICDIATDDTLPCIISRDHTAFPHTRTHFWFFLCLNSCRGAFFVP